MAKKAYIGVDGKARAVKKIYLGVDGKARKVKKAYLGVDGVAELVYQSWQPDWRRAYVLTPESGLICYGDGKFAVLASGGENGQYTLDPRMEQWFPLSLPVPDEGFAAGAICYGGGKFVVLGQSGTPA